MCSPLWEKLAYMELIIYKFSKWSCIWNSCKYHGEWGLLRIVHVGYANSSSCLQVEANGVEMERRSPIPKVVSSAFCSHAFLETFGSADQHPCFLAFVFGSCGFENLCRMSPRRIWWERFRLDGLANVSDHAEKTLRWLLFKDASSQLLRFMFIHIQLT